MGNLRCSPGVAGPTERGRRRNAGTTREGRIDKKKSFIVRSCFATPKRASERPLDGQSRGSHHEPATTGIIIIANHRESHAPRGSDGVTKGLSLRSRGRSRDTMHAKVEYKRIESNRSSLGRARGGLTTTTTTTARMFPSWTDGRHGTTRDGLER